MSARVCFYLILPYNNYSNLLFLYPRMFSIFALGQIITIDEKLTSIIIFTNHIIK